MVHNGKLTWQENTCTGCRSAIKQTKQGNYLQLSNKSRKVLPAVGRGQVCTLYKLLVQE